MLLRLIRKEGRYQRVCQRRLIGSRSRRDGSRARLIKKKFAQDPHGPR